MEYYLEHLGTKKFKVILMVFTNQPSVAVAVA